MSHTAILLVAVFLASAVEMVEALTIVLAVGVTRGWRAALAGTASALSALAVVIALLGPAIALIPINSIRVFVGAILLIFGLQWLRKAILRAGAVKALHDEDAIFRSQQQAARAASPTSAGFDWYTFTVSFKGVFLEGLEVAFIVVTLGGAQHRVALAAAGAAAAAIIVLLCGLVVHRPLSNVPENTLKYGVGLLLTTFGIFWAGEGVGVTWPGSDLSLLGLLAFIFLTTHVLVSWLRRRTSAQRELKEAMA